MKPRPLLQCCLILNIKYIYIYRYERLICTYYGYNGHVVDKCYKLHGYPLGYKTKQRSVHNHYVANNQTKHATVNQVSEFGQEQIHGKVGKFVQAITNT